MKPSYEELLLLFNRLVEEGLEILASRGLSQEQLEGALNEWLDRCKNGGEE